MLSPHRLALPVVSNTLLLASLLGVLTQSSPADRVVPVVLSLFLQDRPPSLGQQCLGPLLATQVTVTLEVGMMTVTCFSVQSFSIPLSELEQRAPCFTDIRYMGCWLAARYSPYNGWSCSATPIQRIHGQVSIKSRRPGLWQQWQQQQTPAVPAGLWADPARVWPAALWATTVWRNPTVWQPVYAKRRICTSSTVPAAAVSHPVQQWAGPPSRCTLQLWGWPYAPWSGMQGSFFCMSYSC